MLALGGYFFKHLRFKVTVNGCNVVKSPQSFLDFIGTSVGAE